MSTLSLLDGHSPMSVMWKTVSEDCNLACDYCYYSRVGGKFGPQVNRIESWLLEKFIKEYMAYAHSEGASPGVASFVWQGGEPLLAGLEFFEEAVSYQAKYARPHTVISNAVQTNATLIDDRWAEFFKQYQFLVGVSLDGPEPIHDVRRVTRAGTGSYRRVMRGIEHLRRTGVDFNILTVLHDQNIHRVTELFQFYRHEGFHYVQFIPAMDFRAQETNQSPRYLISPEEYGQFLCEAFDVWYNHGNPNISVRFFDNILAMYVGEEAELCILRASCPTTLIIEQNGDVYPCDFYISDDYKVGNVGMDTLDTILQNAAYKRFLQKKPALPTPCQTCEWLSLCHGGCPRNRTEPRWMEEVVDVDYFCSSYQQVYRYGHERMTKLAQTVKARRLREYKKSEGTLPDRNDLCICGSGKKFKKCCGPLEIIEML